MDTAGIKVETPLKLHVKTVYKRIEYRVYGKIGGPSFGGTKEISKKKSEKIKTIYFYIVV